MTHSKNFNKVKKYYDEGRWTIEMVYNAVGRWITAEEFDQIIEQPNKTPLDYKNQMWIIKLGVFISKLFGIENRNLRV
jgi:hypothetical protein